MSKNKELNNIMERKAMVKMRAEVAGLLPDARATKTFEGWMHDHYRWYLSVEEYNDPETTIDRKNEAELAYEMYKCEVKAFNDILDDLYVTLS